MLTKALLSLSILLAGYIVLCALLPWKIFRHILVSFVLALVLLILFIPPVHFTNRDFLYPFGQILMLFLLACVGLPIAGRAIWAQKQGQFDLALHNHLDKAMAYASGAVLALFCFVPLSLRLADTAVIPAHITAITLAVAIALKRHAFTRGFALCFAALTFYSLNYPDLVKQAAQHAADQYEITTPYALPHPSLTFLTMSKFPHPRLTFVQDGKTIWLRWSYRRRAFLPIMH